VARTSFSFFARLALALRVVFDGAFARRCHELVTGPKTPPELPLPPGIVSKEAPDPKSGAELGALGLLSLFQREGRLVDFLEQNVESFPDADIGAAARVVHSGCRKALHGHVVLARVRDEAEGTSVTLAPGFDAASTKLTGNVKGAAPYHGVLRHAGWRVTNLTLPEVVQGHDAHVLAPAEIEL
jgi:hypothetical protein